MEILNAQIESTRLGFVYGRMSFNLFLAYGDSSQAWGGYMLDPPEGNLNPVPPFGIVAIRKTLEIVGAESWEALVGKYIRVKHHNAKIEAIGNVLKNDWLNLEELATTMRGER